MTSKQEQQPVARRLDSIQRQVICGTLLGDAHLETQNHGRTYRLKFEQSARHEAYVRHLWRVFEPWVLSGPRQKSSTRRGVEHVSWCFNTVNHAAFRFYAQQFYCDGRKQVPRLIHRLLTPRALAYWFMDDGSMKSSQSKGVLFNTQGFVVQDVRRLADVLADRFKLKCSLRPQPDGFQIYVSGDSYETLLALIDEFLIPEMRYKVPPARRTHMPKM